MPDKYTKNHILQKPELYPKRHYETEKDFTVKITTPQSEDERLKEKHPLLPVLQRLINLKSLSGLLPEPEMKIVNNVNDAYTLLTKSIIYDSIVNPVEEEYINPHNSDVYELPDVKDNSDEETEVPLFPDDPGYEIVTQKQESLYSLSNKRFMADYEDITKDYASSMEQIIHRFFQTMLTLADDAEVPDYSYLMEDFDGRAMYTDDNDLLHTIDYCTKLQRNREADTRLMQKEFTAENTMIRGRALVSAQKQRERYLKENYKINTSALCTTFGNNALFESREMAQKQYENSMYNLYKYLNSSAETMSDILDKRINEAAAKGQLALNGINIFNKIPEPIPTANNLDTNDSSDSESSINSAIDDNAKETAEENPGGIGDSNAPLPANMQAYINTSGLSNWAKGHIGQDLMKACVAISQKTGITLPFVCAQQIREASYDDNKYHNYGGLKDGDVGLGFWGSDSCDHTIFHSAEEYAQYWCRDCIVVQKYGTQIAEASKNGNAQAFIHFFKMAGYFSADEYEYYKAFVEILRDITSE